MIFTFFAIVTVILICTTLFWYFLQYRFLINLSDLSGPKFWPIVGSALEFRSTKDVIPNLTKWHSKYGKTFKLIIGFVPPHIVSIDYDFAEFILTSTTILKKSLIYEFFYSWLGTGLLTGSGAKWKKHRKMITPAFHFKILEQFLDVFEKNGKIFVQLLEKEKNKESFDVYPYVTLLTLDNICETALGTEMNVQLDKESEYARCVKEMCNLLLMRSINPFLKPDIIYKLTKMFQKESSMLKVLHSTTLSVIKNKREIIKKQKDSEKEEENEFGIKKKLAFLDLLLNASLDGIPLSDEELQEEVSTFMFAGHDTTSSAISFALYNLSIYPEVQKKVVDELNEIFAGDTERSCTYSDLQQMKYLEATLKETLRLYPSVPMIGRILEQDIKYDGKIIATGTPIIIFLYGLMRDPSLFPEPTRFNPDRFFSKEENGHLPFSFIPFSAGPRNCIGQKFALLEMKSAISNLLRKFEILPAYPKHELDIVQEITLKSATGVNIGIRKRSHLN